MGLSWGTVTVTAMVIEKGWQMIEPLCIQPTPKVLIRKHQG
jgi:hypothetical protein